MDKTEKKCPLCGGTGCIDKEETIDSKRTHARKLRKAGKSWREIATILGYSSHNSVKHLVNNV